MNFIGIDTGLASIGIARADGTVRTTCPSGKGPDRLQQIYVLTQESAAGISALPHLVAVEGYSYGSSFNAHQMGEAGGIVRLALYQIGVKYIEVAPQQVKKFATGKNTAKKDEMRLGVYKRWGVELETEHDIDAFVLRKIAEAVHAANNNSESEPLNAVQREVVARCISKELSPRPLKVPKQKKQSRSQGSLPVQIDPSSTTPRSPSIPGFALSEKQG